MPALPGCSSFSSQSSDFRQAVAGYPPAPNPPPALQSGGRFVEGDSTVVRKQPLQRLRRWLHQRLSTWVQHLAPDPVEPAAPLQPAAAPAAVGGPRLTAAPGPADESFEAGPTITMTLPSLLPTAGTLEFIADRAALCPGLREPLSVEQAVLARDLTLLKREAADALAALGAAHALVTSARLAQVQVLRPLVEKGEVPGEALKALAADYQGWQNDQVRLFDALALVMRMQVPQGQVLEQVDPALREQAKQHLTSLSVEYQRRQLQHQIKRQG